MSHSLFEGERVRLAAGDSKSDAETFARWSRDSEYLRLLDSDPARPFTLQEVRDDLNREARTNSFTFTIRTLADDKLIGFVGLFDVRWTHGDAFVGIGIGERDYWGKAYGTEAMRLVLQYAFQELNLHRVSLEVFEYNTRARRSYEKAGFVVEGRERRIMRRDDTYYDSLFMGILRQEWEAQEAGREAEAQASREVEKVAE